MFLAKFVERILLATRDWFWNYPNNLLFSKHSLFNNIISFYKKSRPFSHIVLIVALSVIVDFFVVIKADAILRINKDTFIEGVVVGQDEKGDLQQVGFINPLIITNIQIKRDIAELVYESLLKIDQKGDISLVLAESYADLGDGKTFRFKLKENVYWHDGVEFTADDVIETFNLLSNLEFGQQTSSVYSKAATKIIARKIDKYRVEFSFKDKNSVIPNFFEIMTFKIMPAHKIKDLSVNNIIYSTPDINRHPIGTGPFQVISLNGDQIVLYANQLYRNKPTIKKFIFKLYKSQDKALQDLKTGQIHSMVALTSDVIQDVLSYPNLKIHKSNVIYNQYWALYLNLGNSGNVALKDKKVRQALAYAINKQMITDSVVDLAVSAHGPIPETSFAFKNYDVYKQNLQKAKNLLDEAGWKLNSESLRQKDGKVLELNFVYVKNFDRDKVVKVISEDLQSLGIKVNIITGTINEVNNNYVLPAYFDILLYGVSTFIDPDRYELFHSSQIGYPNLNISSYKSEEQTTIIKNGKKERIPKVDYALEKGRSLLDKTARKKQYDDFQRMLMDDVPVIFLYHPVFVYITSTRMQNIEMDRMIFLEDRFNNVVNWKIKVGGLV